MGHEVLSGGVILLSLSVMVVVIFRYLSMPPVLGYLFVGAVVGPHAFGFFPEHELLHLLSEIGVVFLLFMIGLEFSLAQFWSLRKAVLGLGGAQVVLSTLSTALIAYWLGASWDAAFIMGGILALSSTAIVVKQLTEQMEMHSRHGTLAFSVLLFQDIAVVPFLVIIPILGAGGDGGMMMPLLAALVKGVIAVTFMLSLGHWVIRPLFHQIAATRSAELFTLTALTVSITAAWLTDTAGLSLALGAFLAGMMLSETEFKHQIEADVRPFRDILMGLFFIGVGTALNFSALSGSWLLVLAICIGIIFGKGLVVLLLSRALGYDNGVSLRTSLALANGGEFGFALLTLALANQVISVEQSQPIIAAIVLSMILSPFLIRYNGAIAKRVFTRSYVRNRVVQRQKLGETGRALEGHIIFCGYGRVGQHLAGFLITEDIPYVGLDIQPTLVKQAWEAGEQVFYGDSTHGDILRAAGLNRARLVIITLDNHSAAEKIILNIRSQHKELPILVRTRDDSSMETLEKAGATLVLPEILEASMMLSKHMLEYLGVDEVEIETVIREVKDNHYQRLRGYFRGDGTDSLDESKALRLHTILLSKSDFADNKTVGELLDLMDIEITSICRAGVRGDHPEADMLLKAGDALVIQGDANTIQKTKKLLHMGKNT